MDIFMARRVGRLKSKNILGFAHLKASLHVESMWHVPFVILFFPVSLLSSPQKIFGVL